MAGVIFKWVLELPKAASTPEQIGF